MYNIINMGVLEYPSDADNMPTDIPRDDLAMIMEEMELNAPILMANIKQSHENGLNVKNLQDFFESHPDYAILVAVDALKPNNPIETREELHRHLENSLSFVLEDFATHQFVLVSDVIGKGSYKTVFLYENELGKKILDFICPNEA